MPKRRDPSHPDHLKQMLEETGRAHQETLARSRRMGEEIRASTRRLRAAIARFDARNAGN
jgi:hypothetical protein